VEAAVLGGQVGGPDSQSRSAGAHVQGLREVLLQRALDHDLLADVSQRVCDGARWNVAPEHVAHVFAGASVTGHVSKVPAKINPVNNFHENDIMLWKSMLLVDLYTN